MGLIKRDKLPEDNARKRQASELLKNADRLLKEGRYNEALEEVERTLALDPKNFYAKAYKERIAAAMQGRAEVPPPVQEPSRKAGPKEPPPNPTAEFKQKQAEELKKILDQKHREAGSSEAAAPQGRPLTQEEVRKKFLADIRRAEEEAKKSAEEARQRAEQELRRRASELEIMHKREEDQRRRSDEERVKAEEARRKLESDLVRAQTEARKKLDETRQKIDAEKKRIHEEYAQKELEARRKWEEESTKKLDEERRKLQEDAVRKEAEARALAEQSAIRKLEEEKHRIEAESLKKIEQEQRRQKEEEERLRKALEEQRRKIEEEARRQAEEAAKKLEEDRRRIEAESQRKAEEIAKKLDEEKKRIEAEARIQAEQAAKLLAEEKRRIEEEARKQAEEELKKRLEEEQLRKQEEEELKALEEEAKREARSQKIQEYLERARKNLVERQFDQALAELMRIYVINPDHTDARQLEQLIRKEQKELWKQELADQKTIPRNQVVESYQRALKEAWSAGALSPAEQSLLENLRQTLQISDTEHTELEAQAKSDAYADAVRSALAEQPGGDQIEHHLAALRQEMGISEELHASIEKKIREELQS